ncbi:MAG TPA: mannitol dehydrogenase family protein, partial [Alphaproteobacteria bacterium]|nr:mannitol dehydrogenase family protein [Alphaproteobacteria bacterium]
MSNTAQQVSDKAQAGNIKLSQANLPAISDKVKTPAYDRNTIKTGILHISVGGFHRSHQAVYLDKLFGQNNDVTDWGIYGVSAMPNDKQLYTNLSEQDYLYSVLTMSQNGIEPQIIGSIIDGCFAPENPQSVINKIADNDIKIVSLTITEWGYYFDANGNLDKTHPDVKNDLVNPDKPKTALFLIVKGLQQRQQTGGQKLTLLSCDNLQENGHVLEKIVGQIADMIAPEIKGWIAENINFPNSMVDRITPVFNPDDVAFLSDQCRLEDHCPVRCEPFIQWVIEDKFAAGRPPLEEVGVQFVENVAAYEKMKIRLLNANHSALCYLGYLFGHRYVHEVAQDADMKIFMRHVMDEMTPTLDPVPGINVEEYKDILIERFSNPKIADTLLRICNGGSEKFPKFFFAALEILMKDKNIMPKYSAMA